MDAIPYFKFPGQVTFLDDDELFFDGLKKYITTDNKNVLMSTEVKERLAEIINFQPICADTSDFLCDINLIELDDDEHPSVRAVNYEKIISLTYNDKRFHEKVVFVVDYMMPSMNGIEFFQQIKKSHARKIMLTGHEDQKIAISSFNNGIIDRYMVKEIGNIRNKLDTIIDDAVMDYFCTFSRKIFPLSNLHTSEKYIQIFKQWLNQNKIFEFYQCDDVGSYLGMDGDGNLFWLILRDAEQNAEYIVAASNAKLEDNLIRKLSKNRYLLFLHSEKEKNYPVEKWEEYMFETAGQFIVGGVNYYYAFAKNKKFGLDRTKIVPFAKREHLASS